MKLTTKQNLGVVIGGVAVVVLASFLTLYFSGVIFPDGFGGKKKGYQNVTFTDAVLTCEKETRDSYGNKIKLLTVDNHSSRYEQNAFLYKIFLKMNLRNKENKPALHYISCFVKSSNGRIAKYDVYEEKESKTEANRKGDSNAFGWPR
ncbi:hypothetical protein [Teredinibacter sp. KSP-S5-2]|uniref:hypothetical protein n=1 Tax=Teredinibacter sp. KSP-S5-2 TaxID=3034506 RepID=UPI0029340FD1|nr:hypothetical protein [Teredinibacter sp. KSP-S5-2]WNO08782.1 hypothetical protein P5V12_17565 [Teredinibacter sp. KSP-S5-2]